MMMKRLLPLTGLWVLRSLWINRHCIAWDWRDWQWLITELKVAYKEGRIEWQ